MLESYKNHRERGKRRHGGRRHHHDGGPGGEGGHRHGGPRQGGGRGGGPGGGGRRRERVERGLLHLILLEALGSEARHGYEIIKSLEERTRGQYAPSPGAVYPTLQFLEDLGHVRSVQEGDRRVYELTDSGRAELTEKAERLMAFWADFAARAPSEASQHEVEFLKDELEDLSRTVWRSLREAIARGDREPIRRVRLAVEACQNEIRSLITGD